MDNLNITQLVQDVLDGVESPLKAYAVLKNHESLLKAAFNEIEGGVSQEAEKFNEKTFIESGFKFEKRSGGVSWDFKHIDEWINKSQELKDIENKYKAAYNASQGGLISINDGGEITELPICKPRKDSLIIKGVVE